MSPADAAPVGEDGRLAVVVVNYGSVHLVEQNLGRVDLTGLPVHVVVVDNRTTDAEADAVRALAGARGWQAVLLPDNRGFGGGVNAGVAAARDAGCDVVLMLNPDATATAEVLDELRRECLRRPSALVSPRVLRPDGSVWFDGALLDLTDGATRGAGPAALATPPAGTQPWITGACLALHRDLWDRLGGFDERYFLYWEDVDLSARCLAAGGELVVRADLVASHDVGGTQENGSGRAKSALYYRYNCRNRLVFAARHLPRARMLAWAWRTPRATRDVLLRGGRRQLLHRPGLALAAARGSAEGLRHVLSALLRRTPAPERAGQVLVVHPGAELYGSDRMLAESVAGLVDRGCRVTVVLPGPGPLVPLLEALGAEVVSCPMAVVRKSVLTPRGAAVLLRDVARGTLPAVRLLRRRGAGGVYVSTQVIPLWAPLARLVGRRVTTHVHEAEGSAPWLLRFLLALPVVPADRIVLNSRYSRDVLLGALPGPLARRAERRATVVYNGVAGAPPDATARPEGRLRLLYVGRLSPRKGPHVALAALAELRDRGIDAELVLAGSVFPGYEWYEAELRSTATTLGLDDAVRLPGFVHDVPAALAAADVVLIPSLQDEPFGNTAVEAVLAARPVVVSATSGLREAVDGFDSAQSVPPGDPRALADAVERVAGERTRYARTALADAADARRRYDVGRYRSDIADIVLERGTT